MSNIAELAAGDGEEEAGSKRLGALENEKQLIQFAKAGDSKAFQLLLAHYLKPVEDFLSFRVKDKQDLSDLTQETFLRVINNFSKFRYMGTNAFKKWLFTIALNTVNDYWRHNLAKKRNVNSLRLIPLEDALDIKDYSASPEDIILERERNIELLQLLSKLTKPQQEVLRFKYFSSLSDQEIASILKIPVSTVASHVRRGQVRLKKLIIDWENKKDGTS